MSIASATRAVNLAERTVTPAGVRIPAWGVAAAFVIFVTGAAFAPWQQSVSGKGRLIAYSPTEREQRVEAPIKGRLTRWHVIEGDVVQAGDLLVELVDIDADYAERLMSQLDAARARRDAAEEETKAYERQATSLEEARKLAQNAAALKVRMAGQKIQAARQKLEAAKARVETAKKNAARKRQLHERGLASTREVELADLELAKAEAEANTARANLNGARAERTSLQADRLRKNAADMAKLAKAKAAARKASSELAKAQVDVRKLESEVARQDARRVLAPRAGTVLQVFMAEGELVKVGDELARIVPLTEERAVELWIDGNDAPLVSEGRRVRVQFEGWPAVQFVGWPSVAVGTFPGKVAFVDTFSRKNGQFRVVVRPDPEAEQEWPATQYLRQGTTSKGWFLLEQVPLGYELWRRFNGFPVTIEAPSSSQAGKALLKRK